MAELTSGPAGPPTPLSATRPVPRRDPRYPSVYVGQSVVPPTERPHQHNDGYRSSRYVRKYGKHLRPGLYRRFNPMATRDEAVVMEQELARRLRNRGYTMYGGH